MIGFFARHRTIANLLMIAVLALGATMLPTLQRETFPRIEPSRVQITVIYPGARPETVEESVCQRLENAVDGVDDVREITCEAVEGRATATVEMREGASLDRFAADVKTEIDAIGDFPDLVEDPVVRQLGLSLDEVATTIQRQNIDMPVGAIEARDGGVLLRFADERRSVDALRDLIVVTTREGGQVRLGDIARIDDRFELEEVKIDFDGEPAAFLQVSKSAGDDLLSVVARIAAFLALDRQRAPPGVRE